MMRGLRVLLVTDSAVLLLLGAAFILLPEQVAVVFGFKGLPAGVNYIIGLWGCVLTTMALGYFVAAVNPLRHVVWVQIGIARGALECLLGVIYLARGVVTFQQAGFGIVLCGLMATAYVVFYPRPAPRQEDAPATTSE